MLLSVLLAIALEKKLLLSYCAETIDNIKNVNNEFLYLTVSNIIRMVEKILLIPSQSILQLERESYQMARNNFSLKSLKTSHKSSYKRFYLKIKGEY